jgi:pyruvate/2-oxoglutarate dehydrogenase complex dihydrolipoamide dehydrogenase (E3) component
VVVRTGSGAEEIVAGSHLLVATGRHLNVDDLGLDRAGIAYDRKGIQVDRRLRTTNRRVYAVGDVVGGLQFTHVANYHAGIVLRNVLFRLPATVSEDAIPRVTYTDPELAHVGLTEDEARRRGDRIQVLRWPYHENDRAQAERETTGHIKVITTDRGNILGATIVGAAAGEMITTWTLAISRRLNIRALAGIIVPYPTLSEVGKRAAITYFMPRLRSIWLRHIVVWLRRFG